MAAPGTRPGVPHPRSGLSHAWLARQALELVGITIRKLSNVREPCGEGLRLPAMTGLPLKRQPGSGPLPSQGHDGLASAMLGARACSGFAVPGAPAKAGVQTGPCEGRGRQPGSHESRPSPEPCVLRRQASAAAAMTGPPLKRQPGSGPLPSQGHVAYAWGFDSWCPCEGRGPDRAKPAAGSTIHVVTAAGRVRTGPLPLILFSRIGLEEGRACIPHLGQGQAKRAGVRGRQAPGAESR